MTGWTLGLARQVSQWEGGPGRAIVEAAREETLHLRPYFDRDVRSALPAFIHLVI
jgi:hypothetical protein